MTGSQIYSTDFDPMLLYENGEVANLDDELVAEMVRFGDAPLDLLVETDTNRLCWAFRADRVTTSTRRGYYIANFHSEADLFGDFARELMRLNDESEWTFRYDGDLRWESGFQLWRVEPGFPGLGERARNNLLEDLQTRSEATGNSRPPFEFGMTNYLTALTALKGIYESGVDCTVAIGTDGNSSALDTVDILLRPGEARDFEALFDGTDSLHLLTENPPSSQAAEDVSPGTTTEQSDVTSLGLAGRAAIALVFVLVSLSAYSFISPDPIHPITGLGMFGGLVGGILAYPHVIRSIEGSGKSVSQQAYWLEFESTRQRWWLIVGYGSLAGFAYPTIFRIAGRVLGDSQWLFGPVSTIPNSVISVLVYGTMLFALGVVFRSAIKVGSVTIHDNEISVLPLLVGHVLFTFLLLIATGLATRVWWLFVPAV